MATSLDRETHLATQMTKLHGEDSPGRPIFTNTFFRICCCTGA
jgi:hypothetical protein